MKLYHLCLSTVRSLSIIIILMMMMIIIINVIYNAPVPFLQKRAPSTVQLHISHIAKKYIKKETNKQNNNKSF